MDNIDKSLADQITKLGDITPEVLETVIEANTTFYAVGAGIDIYLSSFLALVSLVVAIISLIKDEYGGGAVLAFLSMIMFVVFVCLFSNSLAISKAPKEYAVTKLVNGIID